MKNAVEYVDYTPLLEKVGFNHGENEKTVRIEFPVNVKTIMEE